MSIYTHCKLYTKLVLYRSREQQELKPMTVTTLIYKNFQLDFETTVDVCSIDGFTPEVKENLLSNKKHSYTRKDENGIVWTVEMILHLENNYQLSY